MEGGYKSKSTRSREQYLIPPTHPPLPFLPHTVPAGAFPLFGSMTTSLPSIPAVFGGGRRQREAASATCAQSQSSVGRAQLVLTKRDPNGPYFQVGQREREGREPSGERDSNG